MTRSETENNHTSSEFKRAGAPGSRGMLWMWAFVILVVALGLRVAYIQGQAANNPMFSSPILDAQAHDTWAQQIASGESPKLLPEHEKPHPYYRAPLYYYFLAMIYRVFGHDIVVACMVQAVIGSMTCVLIGMIARRLIGLGGMAVGGLLAALYWPFVVFDAELLTVGLEVFLISASLLVLLRARDRSSFAWFALGGLLFGLAAITRPTVMICWPAVAIWLLAGRLRSGQSRSTSAVFLLLFSMAAAMPVLAVLVRNVVVAGDAVPIASSGGINFFIGNNEHADGSTAAFPGAEPGWMPAYRMSRNIAEQETGATLSDSQVSKFWIRKGMSWIRAHPGNWLRLMAVKFAVFWSPTESPNNKAIRYFAEMSPVSAVFVIGFSVVFVGAMLSLVYLKGAGTDWLLIVLMLLLYMTGVLIFFVNARFRLPAMPMLILLAALGLVGVWRDIQRRQFARVAAGGALAAAAIVALLINPYHPLRMSRAAAYANDQAQGRMTLAIHLVEHAEDDPANIDAAIERLREAVTYDPKLFTAEYLLANLLVQQGQTEEAAAHYNNVLRTSPGFMPAHVMYAGMLIEQRQFDTAGPLLEQAIQLNPNDPVPYRMLGRLLLDQKNLGAARAVLEQAVQRFPSDPEFQRMLMISRFSPSNME